MNISTANRAGLIAYGRDGRVFDIVDPAVHSFQSAAEPGSSDGADSLLPPISGKAGEKAYEPPSVRADSADKPRSAQYYETLTQQLEQARLQAQAKAEELERLRKCLVIALRIISGDKVPAEDYRFLAENEPKLYSQSITLRMAKKDPEEHDRLSEDESEEGSESDGAQRTDGAGQSQSASSSFDGLDGANETAAQDGE